MTTFAQQRKQEDAELVALYDIRTRADVRKIAASYGYADDNYSVEALAFRDKLFGAAARHFGAEVCQACGNLTIKNEVNSHRDQQGYMLVCDGCMEQVDMAVHALPSWVKDRDLTEVIPALVRAFIRSANE